MKLRGNWWNILLLLMVFMLPLALVGCTGGEQNNNEPQYDSIAGNFTFEKTTDNSGYIVVSYDGNSDYVSIPEKYEDFPIKEVGEKAFYQLNIYKVVIPNSVEVIGVDAFSGCTNLIELKLPTSLKKIEINAFYNCSRITNVIVPNSVTEICSAAFASCRRLNTITIGSGVTAIGDAAFTYCQMLKTVVIDSATIFSGLSGQMVYGELINSATTIKVASTITAPAPEFLSSNYTETSVGDYRIFTKGA